MSAKAEQILDEALKLPEPERSALTLRLLDSLGESEDDVRDAWIEEASERLAAIERSETKTVPWSSARKQIFDR